MSLSEKARRAFSMNLDANVVNIDDREEVLEGAFFASSSMVETMTRTELVETRTELARFLREWDSSTLLAIEGATNGPYSDQEGSSANLRSAIERIVDCLGRELASRS